jgi:hypothetical protein
MKHSLSLPSHQYNTEKVVHKNYRMGISCIATMECTKEQLSWMDEGYLFLRDLDERYSEMKGFPISIKLTTFQPSGTLSLLPGVTPGVHPAYARFMIRRVRVASEHRLINIAKYHGYHVEPLQQLDGTFDHNTSVIEFPFKYSDNAKLASEVSAIDQLEHIKFLQRVWSDNAVSCTVYYKKEELEEIKEYLKENYKNNHKSLSFLLHSGHGFVQAPFEEITEEHYNALLAATKPITSLESQIDLGDTDECEGGVCPVR